MRYVFKKKLFVVIVSIFDFFGYLILAVYRKLVSKKSFKIEKILVIRVDHIGDVVNATAVFRPLREAYPEAIIDFMVPSWAKELVLANPYVNKIIDFDPPWFDRRKNSFATFLEHVKLMTNIIKRGKYDVCIDLRGDIRHILCMFFAKVKWRISYGITGGGFLLTDLVKYETSKHEIDKNIELFRPIGVRAFEPKTLVSIDGNIEGKYEGLIKKLSILKPYVIIHPVPGDKNKFWNELGFAEISDYIIEQLGLDVIMIGSGGDKATLEGISVFTKKTFINAAGKTSMSSLAALIAKSEMFIGVDSGPSHIAGTFKVPSILIFSGGNDPKVWAPKGQKIVIVVPEKGKTLNDISPREIITKIRGLYENRF